eukprot:364495-Chlamydomonas_euryale.AAC.13
MPRPRGAPVRRQVTPRHWHMHIHDAYRTTVRTRRAARELGGGVASNGTRTVPGVPTYKNALHDSYL